MSFSSSPLRLLVLVGGLLVLGVGAATMMLSRKHSETAAPSVVRPHGKPVAAKPVFRGGKLAPGAVKPAPRPVPVAVVEALKAGLPQPIARGFAKHDVVVVELYAKEAPLDRMALKEATAGTALAGAALVPIDVTDKRFDKALRKLAAKGSPLESPAVLVFRRPGDLFVRLDGFADHQTVAQAAVNAGA
jgi:hypothetical protein